MVLTSKSVTDPVIFIFCLRFGVSNRMDSFLPERYYLHALFFNNLP